jgi:sugar lactone lactonase YvrE
MPDVHTLLTGLAIGESPRWHDDRLWFANWGTQEVIAVDLDGTSDVVTRVPTTLPYSIDWLPSAPEPAHLLIVSGPEALLLRQEPDGSLATHADLSGIGSMFNEIVVDGRGNAYLNGGSFDPLADEQFTPGVIVCVTPDGSARQVADGIAFGNGMVVTPDNSTLIIAESYGNRLTAFDIADNGDLSNRRVWADLDDGFPDGICLDADGAIWYGDVPNKRCVRVREGGEILRRVTLDRGCFACMLGGADGTTLFILAAQWRGMEHVDPTARTGRLLITQAPAPRVGWP